MNSIPVNAPYATFWQRFAAALIDVLVLTPVTITSVIIGHYSKIGAILILLPVTFSYCAYTIGLHGFYGQTVGKKVMKIRVIDKNGDRINWSQAWLRSSVDLVFAAISAWAQWRALITIPDSEYYAGWVKNAQSMQLYTPKWIIWISYLSLAWVFSEIIVMLSNKRRRSLQDFMAGTIVVADDQTKPLPTPPQDLRPQS